MTSSNGVVMIKSPRQQGLMTTIERGCCRARCTKGRCMLSNSAKGTRNRVDSVVIMCWRRVIVLHLSPVSCQVPAMEARRVPSPDPQYEEEAVVQECARLMVP